MLLDLRRTNRQHVAACLAGIQRIAPAASRDREPRRRGSLSARSANCCYRPRAGTLTDEVRIFCTLHRSCSSAIEQSHRVRGQFKRLHEIHEVGVVASMGHAIHLKAKLVHCGGKPRVGSR